MGLATVEKWLHQCSRCSSCKYIYKNYNSSCPSGEKFWFETFWASGRVWMANALSKGNLKWSDSIIKALFACPLCGNCSVQCQQEVSSHLLDIMESLREEAVKAGVGPLDAHKSFAEGIKSENNPYKEPHTSRLDWLGGADLPEKAEVLYFVGCTSSYRQKKIARATYSVLKKINADFTISPEEWCCTSPLLRTGQTTAAESVVNHNINITKKIGTKTIIFSCAGCFRTFKEDYSRFLDQDWGIEILHVTEYLYNLLKDEELKISKEFPYTVTYHDPCHLGRHVGVYDAPRELLKAIPGLKLIEMSRIRENAWCCGAGGGVKSGFKEWAVEIAKERIKEAEKTNAEYLVSSCPFCHRNLEDAIKAKKSGLKMLDITEILNSVIN
ncbi:MAG: (Fe-S)-binding protein [Candidatus Helarchaeota archaeon]|nr:(Fe-S)-binding protein [Candidatus Helarchaeota archaeon]